MAKVLVYSIFKRPISLLVYVADEHEKSGQTSHYHDAIATSVKYLKTICIPRENEHFLKVLWLFIINVNRTELPRSKSEVGQVRNY